MSELKLVHVGALPIPRTGFIDCSEAGCSVNAVRLNTRCAAQLYFNCVACRNLLIHDSRHGWMIKQNSREKIARRRDEAREAYTPRVGAGWEVLRKMRKAG